MIGARKMLIAFNVNLATTDLEVARRIACHVRASSGGLAHVKGIGLVLEDQGCAQVSLNLVDYQKERPLPGGGTNPHGSPALGRGGAGLRNLRHGAGGGTLGKRGLLSPTA